MKSGFRKLVCGTKIHKGRYTYEVHASCLIFKTPAPLSIYVQNCSTSLTVDIQFQTNPCPLPPPSPTNYRTATAPWTNEFKIKAKPSHVTFKLTTCFLVRFSQQRMPWYHERMASLSDTRVNRKISCQYYINVWLSMISGHSANPIFFNKKKVKIGHPQHLLPSSPTPYVR